ncbi:uncharacterized protein BO95DRAFT_464767 [Aspergillus brunneoviolaceus CBS 621.78]|uniref:Uncharacterized protein n=1 Tax=Aspergillus brunneoviolaceus CBS 621.78 TaxID=1450534 RepID=A0ACD1G5U2_9EURO|nr:hypothetical protein BO95DRAFT_464767 [Aspergillus brunneoviolaceus CBS 621.78]RAH44523.1 hypothetical protein BO95DRAFT_464767 [Aspergillus brunneoviolaceus CBS 621.78]
MNPSTGKGIYLSVFTRCNRRGQAKGLPCEGYPPRYIILEEPSLQRHQRAENLSPGQHTISDASTPVDHISLSETIGRPGELFYRISGVINSGQQYLAGTLSVSEFEHILEAAEQFFRTWDADTEKRAALGSDQKALAEAYRHTCIIRVLRFPDTWRIPCEDPTIAASVVGILDAAASIPTASPWFKRLLFPLFIAGAETSVPHQQRFRGVVHW